MPTFLVASQVTFLWGEEVAVPKETHSSPCFFHLLIAAIPVCGGSGPQGQAGAAEEIPDLLLVREEKDMGGGCAPPVLGASSPFYPSVLGKRGSVVWWLSGPAWLPVGQQRAHLLLHGGNKLGVWDAHMSPYLWCLLQEHSHHRRLLRSARHSAGHYLSDRKWVSFLGFFPCAVDSHLAT